MKEIREVIEKSEIYYQASKTFDNESFKMMINELVGLVKINKILTPEEITEILETYKWIKVKRYIIDDSLSWEEKYKKLDEHHIEETTFLINKLRSIVEKIKD